MTPLRFAVLALIVGFTTADDTKPFEVTYQNPIARVIGLLKKMKKEAETDVKTDAESYDVQACWCETNRNEKTAAVNEAIEEENRLNAEITERNARDTTLKQQIGETKAAHQQATQALAEAKRIRVQTHAHSMALQKELSKDINAMFGAVTMMRRETIDFPEAQLLAMKTVLRNVAVHMEEAAGRTSNGAPHSRSPLAGHIERMRTAFLSMESHQLSSQEARVQRVSRELVDALDTSTPGMTELLPVRFAEHLIEQEAAKTGASSPQSFLQQKQGGKEKPFSATMVFETLSQMLSDMKTRFQDEKTTELQAIEDYKEFRKAKNEQIDALFQSIDEYEDQETENLKKLTDAQENLAQTTATKERDTAFLNELYVTCQGFKGAYEERSETRSKEIKALADALRILTEDDAREHLMETVGFLQTSAERSEHRLNLKRRSKAAEAIRAISDLDADGDDLLASWHNRHSGGSTLIHHRHHPKRTVLAMLAVNAQLRPMPEVKEAIDNMLVVLKEDQLQEVKDKAYCVQERDKLELEIKSDKEEAEDKESAVESKKLEVMAAEEAIQVTIKKKEEVRKQFEKFQADRALEKLTNEETIQAEALTQRYLGDAQRKLKNFYEEDALLQQQQVPKTPAGGFAPKSTTYVKHTSSRVVIQLIDQLLKFSKDFTVETKIAEKAAAENYIKIDDETKKLMMQLDTQRGQQEGELVDRHEELSALLEELRSMKLHIGVLTNDRIALIDR